MTWSRMTLRFISLFILLCFSSSNILAQIFNSSCIVVDGLEETVAREASALALTYTYENQTTYTDSVNLPPVQVSKFFNAVSAVRNLENDITDSIFGYYNFFFSQHIDLSKIGVAVNKNEPWYLDFSNGAFPTGYTPFDHLVEHYNLSVSAIYTFADVFSYHVIEFETDSLVNTVQLASLFDTLSGVNFGLTSGILGDGDYIEGDIFEDYVSLVFSVGEGDCPSGCMRRYFWEFRIYEDCSVEFMGNNSAITSTNDLDQAAGSNIRIYPNPFKEELNIQTDFKDFSYQLYNLSGQLILQGKAFERGRIITNSHLQRGSYILKIIAHDRSYTKLLIKS